MQLQIGTIARWKNATKGDFGIVTGIEPDTDEPLITIKWFEPAPSKICYNWLYAKMMIKFFPMNT